MTDVQPSPQSSLRDGQPAHFERRQIDQDRKQEHTQQRGSTESTCNPEETFHVMPRVGTADPQQSWKGEGMEQATQTLRTARLIDP
jgi:hypothetical protein